MKLHPFSEVVTDVTAKFTKIKASDYQGQGQYKIIDQGKGAVAGYTDDANLVNGQLLPVVVFGDHTRALKYVDEPIALGADGAKALWVNSDLASARYVYYYLRSIQIKEAGYSRHFKFLKEVEIPIPFKDGAPDFDDQIRIAHLLSKVEGLIAQRKQHLQQLDDLLKSVFLEMFGDPVQNERGWDTLPFSQVGKFTSGGTPSKSRDDYWVGEYPWVSPKDMKVPRIFDSEDHISSKVFDETSLKRITPGHLLIVVRGMILAHSFPVAINMVDVSINQDMKAIKLKNNLRTDYVYHCLNALKRQILKLITTAGHGTKKFDSDVMAKLLVPVPPPQMQDNFVLIADKVERLKSLYQQSLTDLESLYGVLSQQAFKGELDLSRVTSPPAPIEGERPESAAVPAPITTSVIALPKTDLLLPALQDRTQLAPLLRFWLEAYRTQLGNAAFSLERFIAAVQTRLAELHPDHDFALSANDYEAIKAWVFDEIQNRKLKQTRDIICIDGKRQFGNQILLRARRHAQQ